MQKIQIFIEGMTCQHCVKRVMQALQNAGVEEADVDIGKANIVFDENKTNFEKIKKAIKEAGYSLKS